MDVRTKLFSLLLIFSATACAHESGGQLQELRRLPEQERIKVFNSLDRRTQLELFFLANQRHPPYSGLNTAVANENKALIFELRDELDARGGVPEVLSFLNIVSRMKIEGRLSHDDLDKLRIADICKLAEASDYCPILAAKIQAP